MRKVLALAAVGLLALSACNRRPAEAPKPPAPPGSAPASSGPAASTAAVIPPRAAGLWAQTVSSRGRTQATQICLDQATEARFTWWGQHTGQGACSHAKVTPRAGGGWTFAASCDMGANGRTETRGEVTGDVARAYKVSAESTISGARAPEMNGTHAMTLEARWQGPCPAGMRPGDMLLPGGMKINVMTIPAR